MLLHNWSVLLRWSVWSCSSTKLIFLWIHGDPVVCTAGHPVGHCSKAVELKGLGHYKCCAYTQTHCVSPFIISSSHRRHCLPMLSSGSWSLLFRRPWASLRLPSIPLLCHSVFFTRQWNTILCTNCLLVCWFFSLELEEIFSRDPCCHLPPPHPYDRQQLYFHSSKYLDLFGFIFCSFLHMVSVFR